MAFVRRCFQGEGRNFEDESRSARKEKRRGGPLFASRVPLRALGRLTSQLVITKGYGMQARTIEDLNALAPTMCM